MHFVLNDKTDDMNAMTFFKNLSDSAFCISVACYMQLAPTTFLYASFIRM